jgi:hypothetical protein
MRQVDRCSPEGAMTKFAQSACFVFMASAVVAGAIASVVL